MIKDTHKFDILGLLVLSKHLHNIYIYLQRATVRIPLHAKASSASKCTMEWKEANNFPHATAVKKIPQHAIHNDMYVTQMSQNSPRLVFPCKKDSQANTLILLHSPTQFFFISSIHTAGHESLTAENCPSFLMERIASFSIFFLCCSA